MRHHEISQKLSNRLERLGSWVYSYSQSFTRDISLSLKNDGQMMDNFFERVK